LKKIFEITDKKVIKEVLDNAEYGTLALCKDNKPYNVPINFVEFDGNIYFHGAKQGKKIQMINENQYASFCVVESYSMIQSYFSSNDNLACPATQFFKSVIMDGKIEFVKDYDEKVKMLSAMMEKLQPEGKYKPLSEDVYEKAINATEIYKLVVETSCAKFKFGQHLNEERFGMIIKSLEERNDEKDRLTIELMKKYFKEK